MIFWALGGYPMESIISLGGYPMESIIYNESEEFELYPLL